MAFEHYIQSGGKTAALRLYHRDLRGAGGGGGGTRCC